eukprot:5941432-Pleurochrysis_carterae.AAC.1
MSQQDSHKLDECRINTAYFLLCLVQIPVDTVQCNLNDWETEGDGMCRGWELLRAANLPDVTA